MTESEALALVAVLQAAFPRFSGGEPTARLFATKLREYDSADAIRGINGLVDTRQDTTWPSWAEVARWIKEARPRPRQIEEPGGERLSAEEVVKLVPFKPRRMPGVTETQAEVEARIERARRALREDSA